MWVSSSDESPLQFLDLDDIDHSEQDYVKSLLYSVRSPRLELPWAELEAAPQQWTQQHYGSVCPGPSASYQLAYHQDDDGDISGIMPPSNEVYQVPVPVQTTMHQIYHPVVPPMANLTPTAYVSNIAPPPPPPPTIGYTMPPQFIYSEERGRRQRSKPSPKRTERRGEPTSYTAAVQYPQAFPIHVPMAPTPYPYIPQGPPHMPSAQHATGPPLYLTPAPTIPVYQTPHIYPSFTPVYSPHVHHDEFNKEQPLPSEEKNEHEEAEKPTTEKPPSLPINAIKTTAPPIVPVKKQARAPSTPTTNAAPVAVVASAPAPATQSAVTSPPNLPPATAPQPPAAVEERHQAEGKSWAALFKEQREVQPKPPITAVAVAPPPRFESKPRQPPRQQNPDEDPLLRRLGACLSTYQLEHRAIVLTPRGLTNPSNYCYINATLQALLACPAFYNLIKTIWLVKDAAEGPPPGASPPKSKTPIIDSMVQFIKEFPKADNINRSGRREKSLWKDKEELDLVVGAPFEPTYVYKMLHALRNETAFQVEGRQEDAEEFLSLLLNGLNDEMLELVKLVEDPNKDTPVVNGDVTANGESHIDDSSDWKEVSKGMKSGRITRRAEMGKTPLSEIFRGQLRSRLQRADEESTDNVQPFFTLPLDIEASDSVTEALEKYFGGNQVEGSGGSTGSGGAEAWQQVSLEELPNVLILHLKCFHYRQQSCHKIAKALEFPIDLKIDSKHVSSKNKSSVKMRQYKLFAVVYHDGKEASKGHYLSDVFHVGCGGWVRYDDAVVRTVTEATLLKPKPPRVPYLLYYRRADTINPHSQLPR